MKYDWKKWGRAAGMRALKTMAQAGIAGIGAAAAMGQVDWLYVASATVLAGILSMLTSVAACQNWICRRSSAWIVSSTR